jgi:hypothetical protein
MSWKLSRLIEVVWQIKKLSEDEQNPIYARYLVARTLITKNFSQRIDVFWEKPL